MTYDSIMNNLSNSSHRASMQQQKRQEYTSPEPKEFTFEGQPVSIVDNFTRAGKRIVVIETSDGSRFEVFMEQLS